jgi:hypothetical protein
MNLRSHTYLIPTLCGTAAFAALVASDYSIRRLANGEGYGMASYLVEVATPEALKPARVAMAYGPPAAVAPTPVAAPLVLAEDLLAEPEPEPVLAEVAVATLPEAQPEVLADTSPEILPEAPPEILPVALPEALPGTLADATAPAEAVVQTPGQSAATLVRIGSEPGGFAARCSDDRGFKRCRIGD